MSSDFISRQALCDDLREYKVYPVPISSGESEVKGYNDGIDLAISVIAEFPSAEPKRKKGNWIIKEENWPKQFEIDECSECGFTTIFQYNFCPNCGADMW